jgi:hypothetical protein
VSSPTKLLAVERVQRAVALLPGEPAGTIAPRTAGAARFRATLAWPRPEDVPPGPTLPEGPGVARCSLVETDDPEAATRCIAGVIRAFTPLELAMDLEATLRTVTEVAALTEAMLEVEAARAVPPRVTSARALEGLARDLWEAGFSVRFEPSWTPAPEADVYLGIGGDEAAMEKFLRAHPSWSVA